MPRFVESETVGIEVSACSLTQAAAGSMSTIRARFVPASPMLATPPQLAKAGVPAKPGHEAGARRRMSRFGTIEIDRTARPLT